MTEEWKAITGTAYEASSLGNIRGHNKKNLKPRNNGNGYFRVCLGANHEDYIHRLVCAAFHGPCPGPNFHADHIDGDRGNNAATNLRWLTRSENLLLRKNRNGEGHHNARLTTEHVKIIHASSAPAARLAAGFGVSRRAVADVRNGKTWRHVNV